MRVYYAFVVGLLSCYALFSTIAEGITLAGQEVQGGETADIRFPVGKYFQDYAAQDGNPRPTTGRALLMFPKGFDPARTWPILVVTSTTDFGRTSPMDAPWYRDPANAEGWIVLASDATIKPRNDSTLWRLGLLGAALEAIRKDWPQSARWPIAFAGLSGGAKRSGVLGAMLAQSGTVNICGFFLAGINDDRLSAAYKEFQPPADFLNVPVWISNGDRDQIAPPQLQEKVYFSIKRTGFQHVRLEGFFGGHQLKQSEVRRALKWFREIGKF